MPSEETTTPEFLTYEFVDEADKVAIINDHIRSLEREHFNWTLNKHRTGKMTLSGDERDKMVAEAQTNIDRTQDALEIAKKQRDELESFVAAPEPALNGSG